MTISGLFEIGKRSLLAYQSAINTTAGNISNVNNENYSRRKAEFGNVTNGVSWDESIRLRQQFAEQQLWQENQHLGRYDSLETMFSQVENIFAEDTEAGFSSVLNQFWNSWNDLANDPESQYARTLVRDKALILSDRFQRMHSDLKDMQQQIFPEVKSQVNEINQKLNQLSDLNQRLRQGKSDDLLDERDKVLGGLSQMLNIKIKEKDSGEVTVYAEGLILISDGVVNELTTEVTTENGQSKAQIKFKKMNKILPVKSGKLSSLLDMHNQFIPEYLQKLDELARNFAQSVNSLHLSGQNLTGTSNIYFFDSNITGAADFKVNEAIVQDPGLIATRAVGEGEGSGSMAQAISDLRFKNITSEGTAANFYQSMLSGIGNQVQETSFLYQSQRLIVQQLQNQRDAVTGVSLDEEMTRMMQFEQAYQAAARIVTTVDEMMQTVLNIK